MKSQICIHLPRVSKAIFEEQKPFCNIDARICLPNIALPAFLANEGRILFVLPYFAMVVPGTSAGSQGRP